MTDLRARLAEAHWELYVSSCRDLASCSHIPATFAELNESEQSYHYRYADVLLSLPGIAIVELPATFIDQTKVNTVRDELKWIHKALEDARQWRDWEEVARLRTRVSHAAALLAAANTVEEKR